MKTFCPLKVASVRVKKTKGFSNEFFMKHESLNENFMKETALWPFVKKKTKTQD